MIKCLLAASLLMFAPTAAIAGDGTGRSTSVRNDRRSRRAKSKYADPRRVVVWLPYGYSARGPKYAVLYMHDGQNLFDKATAGYGMEWEVDEHSPGSSPRRRSARRSSSASGTRPSGCRNMCRPRRSTSLPADYRGKVKALYGGDPLSDGYLKFIVRELRPMIDRKFNVKTDRDEHGDHGILDGLADLPLRDRRISAGFRWRGHDVDALAAGHQSRRQAGQRPGI